ncbi:MAG: hypothetical protein QOI41_3163 [Myxococcales bacterium]|nr:hypothetical protein [Myxococcales bacterium]
MKPHLMAFVVLAAFVVFAGAGCDNRQAFHEPDPTFARMLEQRRTKPYAASSAFEDGKSMRAPPPGTIARDDDSAPPPVTRALLEKGRIRFERVCAACHGVLGDGVSVVATKMTRRAPPSLHDDRKRAHSRDHFYTIVTNGYGLMPSFADVLSPDERWAVATYVKALQLSQHAAVADLPTDLRAQLAKAAP